MSSITKKSGFSVCHHWSAAGWLSAFSSGVYWLDACAEQRAVFWKQAPQLKASSTMWVPCPN